MSELPRRKFIKAAALTAASLFLPKAAWSESGNAANNEVIRKRIKEIQDKVREKLGAELVFSQKPVDGFSLFFQKVNLENFTDLEEQHKLAEVFLEQLNYYPTMKMLKTKKIHIPKKITFPGQNNAVKILGLYNPHYGDMYLQGDPHKGEGWVSLKTLDHEMVHELTSDMDISEWYSLVGGADKVPAYSSQKVLLSRKSRDRQPGFVNLLSEEDYKEDIAFLSEIIFGHTEITEDMFQDRVLMRKCRAFQGLIKKRMGVSQGFFEMRMQYSGGKTQGEVRKVFSRINN